MGFLSTIKRKCETFAQHGMRVIQAYKNNKAQSGRDHIMLEARYIGDATWRKKVS